MGQAIFNILVFPGIAFLAVMGMAMEYVDRKLAAKMQNRVGPPWFQPLADFIKLLAKQEVVPEMVDIKVFKLMPVIALAATVTAFLYVPMWDHTALMHFSGDLIVVLYLLTIPTLAFFLGGWYSRSVYSMIGAARSVTQIFAYEIPLFLAVLAPALLADTWSLEHMTVFYDQHPVYALFNLPAAAIALVALLGKLERVPFDIPEAETEIVAGCFTEYGGRLLGLFRLCVDVEMVVGASLLAAVFLPFGLGLPPVAGFVLYLLKVLLIVGLISLLRTVVARLRIDQMIHFFWKIVAPFALLQLVANVVLKGVLAR